MERCSVKKKGTETTLASPFLNTCPIFQSLGECEYIKLNLKKSKIFNICLQMCPSLIGTWRKWTGCLWKLQGSKHRRTTRNQPVFESGTNL